MFINVYNTAKCVIFTECDEKILYVYLSLFLMNESKINFSLFILEMELQKKTKLLNKHNIQDENMSNEVSCFLT